MPAFARRAGGPLTNAQIDVLVRGLRRRWSKPGTVAAAGSPPYAAPPGDAARGRDAYAVYCASCHGRDGKGGRRGGSVVDGAYLALVSDQGLRTTVIAGRPALGMPDFRSYVPGRPMSAGEIADVVAWLAAQRPEYSGQPYAVPEGPLSGAVGEAPPRGGMQP
jgi:cytochrome c5